MSLYRHLHIITFTLVMLNTIIRRCNPATVNTATAEKEGSETFAKCPTTPKNGIIDGLLLCMQTTVPANEET